MLTTTQRAERAAKKRNKKIAQEYPLLAGQFAVTIESQIERLEKQETDNISYKRNREKQAAVTYVPGVIP